MRKPEMLYTVTVRYTVDGRKRRNVRKVFARSESAARTLAARMLGYAVPGAQVTETAAVLTEV